MSKITEVMNEISSGYTAVDKMVRARAAMQPVRTNIANVVTELQKAVADGVLNDVPPELQATVLEAQVVFETAKAALNTPEMVEFFMWEKPNGETSKETV